jgi:TonB family protein
MTHNFDIKDYLFSVLVHTALFLIILLLAPEGRRRFSPLEVTIIKNEKVSLPQDKDIVDLTKKGAGISPSHVHRSKKGVRKKTFKPVVGVTEESVAEGSEMSVPIGNTLMGAPENKVNVNVDYAPLFTVTKMPSFKVQIKPEYPEEARRLGIEGVVMIEVAISAEGKVIDVKILEEPGFGLGEAARSAIMQSEFEPAMSGDTPVAVRVRIPVRFRLVD